MLGGPGWVKPRVKVRAVSTNSTAFSDAPIKPKHGGTDTVCRLHTVLQYFLSRVYSEGITMVFLFSFAEKRRVSMCVGCGSQIHDQYILRVSPDLEWHASCLKCADCHTFLDETCTCFVKDGKTYCKRDYVRWALRNELNFKGCAPVISAVAQPALLWPVSYLGIDVSHIRIATCMYFKYFRRDLMLLIRKTVVLTAVWVYCSTTRLLHLPQFHSFASSFRKDTITSDYSLHIGLEGSQLVRNLLCTQGSRLHYIRFTLG